MRNSTKITQHPLKTAIDALPGYFFVTDTKSTILYTNKAIENRTGYAIAEAIGKKPGQLWGGNMPSSFYQNMWQFLKTEESLFTKEVVNIKKNKEHYQEDLHILPVFENSRIEYFIGFQPQYHTSQDKAEFISELNSILHSRDSHQLLSYILSQGYHKTEQTQAEYSLSYVLKEFFIQPTELFYQNRKDDTSLILAAQKNTAEFQLLYNKYYSIILSYFKRRVRDSFTAEDLSQEVFTRAFSHLAEFKNSNASYQTYLLRIAHNTLVNHYRKTVFAPLEKQDELSFASVSEKDHIVNKLTLEKEIGQLSMIEQKVISLMYQEGLSVREIANKINKTENAVKLLLSRARKKLKKKLQ